MMLIKRLIGTVRGIVYRERVEAELDDEMRDYLTAAVDAKVAAGMGRDEALRQARAEFGSAAAAKDWVRDVGWESRVESVWQDVRHAARMLRRSPGFAAVAIATFALGIGANTAIFSIVDATLLKPLPFAQADRLAAWLIPTIPALLPPRLIAIHEAQLDWRVLGTAIGASVAAGVLSGLLPALRGSQPGAAGSLASAFAASPGPAHRRARNALVTTQVAFASTLLLGAGLMMSSLVRMIASDPGYRLDGLVAVTVSLTPARYPSPAHQRAFFSDLLELARGSTGGMEVTLGTPPPQEGAGSLTAEDHRGDADSRAGAALLGADPDYFRVLGIPIVSGRAFSADDREGSPPVAVIDDETARRFWPGQSALGKRVRHSPYVPWMTVVGVARDVKTSRAGGARPSFELYVPMLQDTRTRAGTLIARADGRERPVLTALRALVEGLDREAKVTAAGSVRELYGPSLVNPRFTALAMSTFAMLALLTAAVGLYGVLAYAVSRRTSEIGIRLALGARAADVRRLVVREALVPVAAGLVIGLAAAQALSRFIAAQLYQMTPRDPVTLVVVVSAFVLVAAAAAYVPARRATRVDPVIALRSE